MLVKRYGSHERAKNGPAVIAPISLPPNSGLQFPNLRDQKFLFEIVYGAQVSSNPLVGSRFKPRSGGVLSFRKEASPSDILAGCSSLQIAAVSVRHSRIPLTVRASTKLLSV